MILSNKTLEILRDLINEQTEYRSGPKLVAFFNQLGFNDTYHSGFPSRGSYTFDKLTAINGTPQIDECIKNLFSPINFVGRYSELDNFIRILNQYLIFDQWQVSRKNTLIFFERAKDIKIPENKEENYSIDEFLIREFSDLRLNALGLESSITQIIEKRITEIEKCFTAQAPLAAIFLAGSTLEGILLGIATKHAKHFNCAKSAPKDNTQKVKRLHEWSLENLINSAKDLQLIRNDTHKFSHALRDFRNYIHPFEQMSSGFSPRENTAKICLQVLKSAIHDLEENQHTLK